MSSPRVPIDSRALVALFVCAVFGAVAAEDRLWVERFALDGVAGWRVEISPPSSDPTAAQLAAPPWHPPLPELDVRLLGGETFSLGPASGSVVVLDFWASWCGPCLEELPHLQELYASRRNRGLEVVAINVLEPPHVFIPVAEDLGLEMPIGVYDRAMAPRLYRDSLPTILVADRRGRIRGRWDGYRPGFERDVALLVDRLLDEDRPADQTIASIIRGPDRLRAVWSRRTSTTIDDVHVVARGEEQPQRGILVAQGRLAALHGVDGRTLRRWDVPRTLSRLRPADPSAFESSPLAAFRPGGTTVEVFETIDRPPTEVDCRGHVFDVRWSGPPDAPYPLLVATDEGIRAWTEEREWVDLAGSAPSSSLALARRDGDPRHVALGFDRTVRWIGEGAATGQTSEGAWRLVEPPSDGAPLLVTSHGVLATAGGRLLPGDSSQVALAHPTGLTVVNAADGTLVFEAFWPGISALAAGDLDGDGLDELLVATRRQLTLIAAPSSVWFSEIVDRVDSE